MRIIIYGKDENLSQIRCREFLFPDGNPDEWRGITAFGDFEPGSPDADTSLFDTVRKSADQTGDKAQLLLVGNGLVETARKYYGYADRVFVYDDPALEQFDPEKTIAVFRHFIENYKPAAIYIPDSDPLRPVVDAVLDITGDFLNAAPEASEYETVRTEPDYDAAHLGELVICEIPDGIG